MASAFFSASRNVQIVLASGTPWLSDRPRKRMKESRSLIRYSVRSSGSECTVWRIGALNIGATSNGGRRPFERSALGTAASSARRNISKSTTAVRRSRSSPFAESSARGSSKSKIPGTPVAMIAPRRMTHEITSASKARGLLEVSICIIIRPAGVIAPIRMAMISVRLQSHDIYNFMVIIPLAATGGFSPLARSAPGSARQVLNVALTLEDFGLYAPQMDRYRSRWARSPTMSS